MTILSRSVLRILILIFLIASVSCKKAIKNRADLIEYINNPENGLKVTEEAGKIKAELMYKPWQLVADNQENIKKPAKRTDLNSLKNKYFFVLSLSANNKELLRQLPFTEYSEMVQVLSFRMMTYISVIADDAKPISPVDCLFLQTYGMSDANRLLVVFNNKTLKSAKQLKIKVSEFGLNIGDLRFQFETKDINDLSNIAIN